MIRTVDERDLAIGAPQSLGCSEPAESAADNRNAMRASPLREIHVTARAFRFAYLAGPRSPSASIPQRAGGSHEGSLACENEPDMSWAPCALPRTNMDSFMLQRRNAMGPAASTPIAKYFSVFRNLVTM